MAVPVEERRGDTPRAARRRGRRMWGRAASVVPLEDRPSSWWTGVAGLALTATLVPAIVTETAGPDAGDSPAAIASEFASSRTTVLVSGALFLTAMMFGLAFVIGLTSLPDRGGRDHVLARIASASGLLVIAMLTVYAASFAAIAASIDVLHPHQSLVYAVFRVTSAIDDGAGIFIAIFVVAIAYPLVHAGYCPRWLAHLGLAAAAVRVIGTLDVTTLGALPFAPFMAVGTVLCVIWLGLISVGLLRVRDRPRPMRAPRSARAGLPRRSPGRASAGQRGRRTRTAR